jgi:hypothetical protein
MMNRLFVDDFTTKQKHIDCSIGYLLRKECLNSDGTIKNNDCSKKLQKKIILHYLAYLCYNNSSLVMFSNIKSTASFKKVTVNMIENYIKEHQPSFSEKVLNSNGSLKYITNTLLISFVNHLITTNKDLYVSFERNSNVFNNYLDHKLKKQNITYDKLLESIQTKIKNPVIRSISTETKTHNGGPVLASVQVTQASLRRSSPI